MAFSFLCRSQFLKVLGWTLKTRQTCRIVRSSGKLVIARINYTLDNLTILNIIYILLPLYTITLQNKKGPVNPARQGGHSTSLRVDTERNRSIKGRAVENLYN